MRFLRFAVVLALFVICSSFNSTLQINTPNFTPNYSYQETKVPQVAAKYRAPHLKQGQHHVALLKFNTEVSSQSAEDFVEALKEINEAGAEAVVIQINSPGGSVNAGYLITQAIQESNATTICVADKLAASMGSYILEACQVRLMTRSSELLIHEPSISNLSVDGTQKDIKNAYERMHSLTEAMMQHYARRSKLSVEQIRKKIEHGQDWWLGWEEALKDGFVEGIVVSAAEVRRVLEQKGLIPLDKSAL